MGGVRSRERGGHSKHKVKSKDCGVVSSEQKFYPGKWKGRKQLTIQQVWKTRKGESTWASPECVCAVSMVAQQLSGARVKIWPPFSSREIHFYPSG